MSRLSDPAIRRRLELNPITTSMNVVQQQQQQQQQAHQTPLSAVSSSTLSAQFGYQPAYTPQSAVPSAVRQYNPQQWGPSPNVLPPDQGHAVQQFALRRTHDPEVVTPAPPPYSPPRSSTHEQHSRMSPAAAISPPHAYRSSPELSSNPVFQTPPPPHRRAPSSERPQSFFSSFANRRQAPEVPYLSPEVIQDHTYPTLATRPRTVAIEPLHIIDYNETELESRPPASRRAASAGAISTTSSSRSRGSSVSRWEPGMPLPPPPPGLPPTSRSQSMNRTTDQVKSPPTRRPGASMGSSLGPVPPTPAGWVDEDIRRAKSPNNGLVIDTSSVSSGTIGPESTSGTSGSSSSGLARQHAIKGETRSIRERRSESKSGKMVGDDISNNPWAEAITPSDSGVPPLTILGRRSAVPSSTTTPRSATSYHAMTPKSADMSNHSTPLATPHGQPSRGTTPRPTAPTPPFSPNPTRSTFFKAASPSMPPKALPTPPPQSRMSLSSPAHPRPQSSHMVNSDPRPAVPRSGSRPASRQSMSDQMPVTPAEQFSRSAIERHQAFAQKEIAATNDTERVRIFAEFIVTESRLRRERYASAIDAMGSEILELTRDLFKPYSGSRRESTASKDGGWTPESSTGPSSRSHRSSIMVATQLDNPQLQTRSEPTSGSGQVSPAVPAGEGTFGWNNYKPSLSPIPSINTHSLSEALDGSDSRGRPSSRWWEVSDGGSNGNQSMRLERSKRESKYMGIPAGKLQFDDGAIATANAIAGPSKMQAFGPNEYPPEKVGMHEQEFTSPPQSGTTAPSTAPFSPPFTPNPNHLDVSRLVTLPPPYPRHYPAVNNNHPDLTSIRTAVRALSDMTEVEATKDRFAHDSTRLRSDAQVAASQRRASLRSRISHSIEAGTMTFAAAAELEDNAAITETEKAKEVSKAEFAMFQEQVVGPLNSILMERVDRATHLFEQLKSKLSVEAQPNSTQEEGDEQPELLEKLTLLKWIFEAREMLHREVYDILSDRNDRYRDMVIAPYKLSNNTAKIASSMKFFAADGLQRKLQDEQEILKRTEEFMDIVEKNVRDGVEALLNAFWDIAPSLSRITEKIPRQLRGFEIQIPRVEYEENPSYHDFPMQYLYSLLGHCEKSTYQFIESQTNLLCLLHEVKSGVTVANCRLMRTQRVAQGEEEEEVDRELKEVESDEEGRLTDDLKEKVRCVEELWKTGLGTELKGIKEMIVRFLVEEGGWMEDD